MTNHEIALAVSAGSFGMFIGFLTGYAVRAYVSYLRRSSRLRGRISREATLNRGPIEIAPAQDDSSKAATGKRWQDAETIWSIWMMASQDPTSFLSYQSVASRLYGPITDGKKLTAKVAQVRDLVGRWRELFRLNANPGDFKNWKDRVDKNFECIQNKQDPDGSYPEWLLDLSMEDQKVQLDTLQTDVFRSQLRVGQDRGKKFTGGYQARLGLHREHAICAFGGRQRKQGKHAAKGA